MTKEVNTQIHIHGPAALVWEVFSDFKSYKEWNPFIREVKGEVAIGNKIEIQPTNQKAMSFKPKVLI